MTFDVFLGPSKNKVMVMLFAVTDKGAAQRICEAINAERPMLFQASGLRAYFASTERPDYREPEPEPEPYAPDPATEPAPEEDEEDEGGEDDDE